MLRSTLLAPWPRRTRRQTQAEARSQESVSERCASSCNLASRNCNRLTRPSLDWPAASFSLSFLQPPRGNHTIGAGGEGWAPTHWRCSSCQMRRHSLAPPWLRQWPRAGGRWVGLGCMLLSEAPLTLLSRRRCHALLVFFPPHSFTAVGSSLQSTTSRSILLVMRGA